MHQKSRPNRSSERRGFQAPFFLDLDASWAAPGAVLARLGCQVGGNLGQLGTSWVRPEGVLDRLGASWERLGASWARLGASLGRISLFSAIFNGFWLRFGTSKSLKIIDFPLVFLGFFDFRGFQHKY